MKRIKDMKKKDSKTNKHKKVLKTSNLGRKPTKFKLYYREMIGINLKRKVNFKRKMKDGMAVVEIIEDEGKSSKLVPDNRLDC